VTTGPAALDRALLAFATDMDSGPPGGPACCHYEYLLVIGTARWVAAGARSPAWQAATAGLVGVARRHLVPPA
jgi:hypothetical protein